MGRRASDLPRGLRPLPGIAKRGRGAARLRPPARADWRTHCWGSPSPPRSTRPCCCPIALIESWERGGRELARRGLVWFVGVLFAVHLPFLIAGPGGVRFSYWVQIKRGLEVESLGAGPCCSCSTGWAFGSTSCCATRRGRVRRTRSARSRRRSGRCPRSCSFAAVLLVCVAVPQAAGGALFSPSAAAGHGGSSPSARSSRRSSSTGSCRWCPVSASLASGHAPRGAVADPGVFVRFMTPGRDAHRGRRVRSLTWWVFARDVLVVALFARSQETAVGAQDPGGIQIAKPTDDDPRVAGSPQERPHLGSTSPPRTKPCAA